MSHPHRRIAQRARNRERDTIAAYLRRLGADDAAAPFLEAAADLIQAGYHRTTDAPLDLTQYHVA